MNEKSRLQRTLLSIGGTGLNEKTLKSTGTEVERAQMSVGYKSEIRRLGKHVYL